MTGENRLPVLAVMIKSAVEASRNHARATVASAIKAGAALIEAKALVPHGGWLDWLKANVEMSERTAQVYMRLAKRKEVVDAKSAAAADLTIAGAIEAITGPGAQAGPVPATDAMKLGVRESAEGWDEIWVAPSFQHPGFYYVTHIWTGREGKVTICGLRKPVAGDYVTDVIGTMIEDVVADLSWSKMPSVAWPMNHLLFGDVEKYIASFKSGTTDIEDVADLADGRLRPDSVPKFFGSEYIGGDGRPFHRQVLDLLDKAGGIEGGI
jgi:hypothetical protein